MRLPLIWRPAPAANVTPATVTTPVGLVDLAPTFCDIAGLSRADWMQGNSLPVDDSSNADERVLTEWDSELFGVDVHLRTITRDRWVCTAYRPGTVHDGSEGELYDVVDDPLQRRNLWGESACRSLRDDLLTDLWDNQPEPHPTHIELQAPV
jgi:arylsulfatase A-like enzyme